MMHDLWQFVHRLSFMSNQAIIGIINVVSTTSLRRTELKPPGMNSPWPQTPQTVSDYEIFDCGKCDTISKIFEFR